MFCEKCHGFRSLTVEHVCPPLWTVWLPDPMHEDDPEQAYRCPQEVYAYDAEVAAKVFAQQVCCDDSEEYETFIDGTEVMVRDAGGKLTKVFVSGETTVMWRAKEVP